jgi:hypothetical protein
MPEPQIIQYVTDVPVPSLLPGSLITQPTSPQTPPNRNTNQHENTSRNTQTQQQSTLNRSTITDIEGNCNCGIISGYKYEFDIIYKKTEQSRNPNTNQVRRDWLYLQLVGNIISKDVITDRVLIYLK